MMNYKGTFNEDASYDVGDVVVYEDGVAYRKILPDASLPHDVRCWERVEQPLQETVLMFHGYLCDNVANLATDISALQGVVFDDKTLVLASSTEESVKKFALTVDDSGELDIDEIVEEDEGDGE